MKPAPTILLLAGATALLAVRKRSARVGAADSLSSTYESKRVKFDNEFGSFTSVFIYVPIKNASEYLVQTTVRKSNGDGTLSISKKERWLPVETFSDFINDLQKRTSAKIGIIYKEIPQEFYPCVDGTYSDHNRNRACTRHGGLITDEAIRLCNGVELEGSELQVHSIPVKDIQLYLKKFQNRETPYSEESVQRILTAAHSGTFRFEEFDPVLLWRAPDGHLYMLSGHSRLEAFTRLSNEGNTRFNKIPAKIVAVPQAEAEEIALRSNTLSTKEKDYERAMFYRKQIEIGRSYAQIIETARKNEGKDAMRIVAYAYLNPFGKAFTALKSLEGGDPTSQQIIKSIAQWIGEARMKFPMLSNLHEDEIYTWLVNGAFGKQYKQKNDFLKKIAQTIQQRTTFGNFDADKPLNLLNVAVRSFSEQQYYEGEEGLKEKIAITEKLIKDKTASYRAGGADTAQILKLLQNDYGYLNRLRVELSEWMQKKNSILAQGQNQSSLFAMAGYRISGLQQRTTVIHKPFL